MVFEVQEDQGCGDDLPDAPGVQADLAQRPERHLQPRVTTLPHRPVSELRDGVLKATVTMSDSPS